MNKEYKLSLIIPVYNESEGIPILIDSLNGFFEKYPDKFVEIIFVNDGSSDNSLEVLKNTSHRNYDFKIISLSKNYGAHAALRAGIANSSGEYITVNYSDLQDPLELIDQMLPLMGKGNDIVWAVRNKTKSGLIEKIFSSIYAKLIQIFVNPIFPNNGIDILMFNSKIRNELNNNIETNSSIILQIMTLGFKNDFIYYDKLERKIGKSKWTFSKKIKVFIDSFVAFSYAPIRMVTITGFIFFFLGLFWTIYIVLRYFLFHDLAPGWPALVSILMICFGISNISLGIIAEYLWRTLDASRKRPVFIIDELFEIKNNEIDTHK